MGDLHARRGPGLEGLLEPQLGLIPGANEFYV